MTQIITNNSGGGGGSKVIVVDDLNTPSSTSALSANQGYVLKGMIDDLMAQGRFLSLWNCATGQPISFPMSTPYTYSTGDYFMVEVLDSGDPATNYRPNGSSYNGTASSTAETGEVAVGDYYVYDGAVWLLASNHGKTVSFANLAGQPTDNVPLGTALAGKQDNWIEVNVATAYGTAAKVGTTTAGNYTPTKGDFLLVNFVNGCSVASPTLNIDGSGAKAIRTGNAAATTSTFALGNTANSNIKALLYYDGTYYRCWSTTDSNTTYSTMGVSEGQAGTATNQRSMRADYLKQIIKYHAVDNSRLSDDWYSGTTIAPSQASIYYEFAKRELQAGTDLEIVPNSSHNLPEGYTELSFLGGSGSGYINTGNILQCKDTIKIKFKRPTATAPSSTQSFFGSLQGSNNVPRSALGFRTNGYVFGGANQTVDFAPIDTNIHTIEVGYDGVDYYYKYDNGAKTTYTPTSTTEPSINAYLFARNGSSVTYSGGVRIYYLEWARNDGTDVAHLIPAQRDSDGVLGMYDLVNETFLAPAGSGTWSGEPLGNVINFTNDSGFITSADVPTKTSDLNNDSGFVTNQVDDTAYGSGWDGKTTKAPSQNAVYDKISSMDTTISSKAADSDVVKLTGDQTIAGTKTFSTSPVVPSKSTDAANTATAIATEAQVYKKQDKLTTQTVYTSKGSATKVPQITTNSLGQVTNITEVTITQPDITGKQDKATSGSTAPSTTPTYVGQQYVDTTNDKLYVATGTSSSSDWKEVGSGGGGGSGDVTGPESSTDGNVVLFDGVTGKIIKDSGIALSSKADASDLNTKTFYLSGTSDLTNAQAAYDWWSSGKNSIIIFSGVAYFQDSKDSTSAYYYKSCNEYNTQDNKYTLISLPKIKFNISSGTVTSVLSVVGSSMSRVLATNVDYSTPYTPQYDGSPATKKYVDDSVSVVSGDSGTTYTIKVSNSDPTSGTASNIITLVP